MGIDRGFIFYFYCCKLCVQMVYLQDTLNRYRKDQLKFLQSEYNKLPDATLSQRIIKLEKEIELKLCKNEALDGDRPLHRKPRHALFSGSANPIWPICKVIYTLLFCHFMVYYIERY